MLFAIPFTAAPMFLETNYLGILVWDDVCNPLHKCTDTSSYLGLLWDDVCNTLYNRTDTSGDKLLGIVVG